MSICCANAQRALLVVGGLAKAGVAHFVVSPGSRNTPLILALEQIAAHVDSPDIHIHRILDERSAGFFALGLGRASGRPAALICTSGTAAAHYYPAVIEASQSGIGMLMLTADRPEELRGVGALQTIDQNKLFGDYVRKFLDLGTPGEQGPTDAWVVATAQRAYQACSGENAGPVHLNLPFREPLWNPDEPQQPWALPNQPAVVQGRKVLDPGQIRDLRKTLGEASRGVIIVGPRVGALGEHEAQFAKNIADLSRQLRWPIIAEPGSGVRCQLANDRLVTAADVLLRSEQFGASVAPNLVLRFGKTVTSKAVRLWAAGHGCPTILVENSGSWHDPDSAATQVVTAEPASVVASLCQESGKISTCDNWLPTWQRAQEIALAHIARLSNDHFWEGGVARQVAAALPEHGLLHVANSMPIRDLDAMAEKFSAGVTLFHHRGANGIDGSLSALLGEATALGQPAVLLCGDLSFLHDLGALNLAAQEVRPVTVVVIDNRGGGIFEHLPISQHSEYFERNFITPHEQDLVTLCRGAGLRACQATSAQALSSVLAEESLRPGVGVVVVPSDREANTAHHQELWSKVAVELSSLGKTGNQP